MTLLLGESVWTMPGIASEKQAAVGKQFLSDSGEAEDELTAAVQGILHGCCPICSYVAMGKWLARRRSRRR